jgi:hypothetical protein
VKARLWGSALLLVAACAALSGCYSGLNGAAVAGGGPPAATSATTTSTVPVNLVANGSFETSTAWQPMQPYSRLLLTSRLHRFGEWALLAQPSRAGVPYFGAQVEVLSHPAYGTSYRAQVWVKCGRHAGNRVQVTLFIVRRGAKGYVPVIMDSRTRSPKGRWRLFTLRGTVASQAAEVLELQVAVKGGAKRWSRFVVDGVSVVTPPAP